MIVDGKAIASDVFKQLANQVSHLDVQPHMTVFTCAPNFATKKYLNLKTKRAKEVGVGINVIELPESITTEEAMISIEHAAMQTDGIIVQLPLPDHLDVDKILGCVPAELDIDGFHYDGSNKGPVHPVAGAIALIAERYDVLLAGQNVVVVGHGRLVGAPAAHWARSQGAKVTVVTEESDDREAIIRQADVLILGVGQPGLVTADMVKDGVIIFDAGTSELGGQLVGDADYSCQDKAALFTPVPGGIGPVTVAVLLQNLVSLVSNGQ